MLLNMESHKQEKGLLLLVKQIGIRKSISKRDSLIDSKKYDDKSTLKNKLQ